MLNLNTDVKNKFAAAALKTFNLSIFGEVNNDEAIKTMVSDLDELLELNDPQVMGRRHDFFKVPNSKPNDYQEQVFQIAEGKSVLAGIRHAGGNIERPFINLWPDYELQSLEDVSEAYSKIVDQFKLFSPKDLSFWLNPESSFAVDIEKQVSPNLRYIVALVDKIKTLERPNNYDRVSFHSIQDSSYRSWYEDLYLDFHSKNKELKDWVPLNDEEDMDDCLKDGLLFFINIDGKRAGLIGGRKEKLLGKLGVYFVEILLSSDFKGQGLAPAVQRRFIDQLSGGIELIWGTIDSKNIPSTKTAIRVGRVSMRSEYFLPLSLLKQ